MYLNVIKCKVNAMEWNAINEPACPISEISPNLSGKKRKGGLMDFTVAAGELHLSSKVSKKQNKILILYVISGIALVLIIFFYIQQIFHR